MLLKSFFRKKNVKIYVTIITILYLAIFAINISSNYLIKVNNDDFKKRSLLYVNSSKDNIKLLSNEKYLEDIKRCLIFDYNDNLIYSYDLNLYDINNKTLVYKDIDHSKVLKENEIIINLNHTGYINIKDIDELKNQTIKFEYQNKTLNLVIKDIVDSEIRSSIIVSSNLFNKLINDTNYCYVASISEEKQEGIIFHKLYDDVQGKIELLTTDTSDSFDSRERIGKYINMLNIASVVACVVFIILLIVINRNIISDLDEILKLENFLGFRKKITYKYLLLRLISVHVLSLLLNMIILLPLIIVFEFKIDIKLILILIGFNIVCDLLLSLIVNNKSKKKRKEAKK